MFRLSRPLPLYRYVPFCRPLFPPPSLGFIFLVCGPSCRPFARSCVRRSVFVFCFVFLSSSFLLLLVVLSRLVCLSVRALLLSRLSDVSQTLGQLQRPGWLVRARDSSLARYVPSALRSRVFDALMSASLAGGLAGAVAAAAGAATGTGVPFGGYRVPRL